MDNSEQKYHHPELVAGRWARMTLVEQMANIGSEVYRTLNWMERGNEERSTQAFYRALELIDLSIAAPQRSAALKELCRLREFFCQIVTERNLPELRSLNKDFDAWGLAYAKTHNKA